LFLLGISDIQSRHSYCCQKDSASLTLKSAQFLVENPDVLPHYNVLKCNCEPVAWWCSTGTWATLQVLSALIKITGSVAGGGAVSYRIATALVTAKTIAVPAAGLWGWLGFTEEVVVTMTATHPLVLAAIARLTPSSVGVDVIKAWVRINKTLNQKFNKWNGDCVCSREMFPVGDQWLLFEISSWQHQT
jgi:hypothetical protein